MNYSAREPALSSLRCKVHVDRGLGPLKRFWRSTGFSPAELLLDPDMQQSLVYMASLPGRGIEFVRIHYLYNLLRVERVENGAAVYDWTLLDQGMDVLVQNGLRPIFELMGNPSDYFEGWKTDAELHAWRALVRDTARRYLARYGAEEVRRWYFEPWNEADQPKWWPHGIDVYCRYYDACSEGLRDADPALRFGGPASAMTLSPLFKALMAHCDTGKNWFTGEPVRLDFISVHEKGARASREDLTPDLERMCRREQQALNYLRDNHPRLLEKPFVNDESDPQVGWSDIHTWHALPYYAALLCRMIGLHQQRFTDKGVDYEILSNDNAFMGGWGNRTLFTLFGGKEKTMAQSAHRTILPPKHEGSDGFPPFSLVKKPILNAMALLGLLEGERCTVDLPAECADIGSIATRRPDGTIAVLVYCSRDHLTGSAVHDVTLSVGGVAGDYMLTHYRIDEDHGNPFRLWEAWDGPAYPSDAQLAALRSVQEIVPLQPARTVSAVSGQIEQAFFLPMPWVSLLLLTPADMPGPSAPGQLRAIRSTGVNGGTDILFSWAGSAQGAAPIRYEIEVSTLPEGPYSLIDTPLLLGTAWLAAPTTNLSGRHVRVRATDAWGNESAPSESIAID
jgi:L-iduronidase